MRQPSYDRLFVTSLCVAAAVFASLGSSLLRAEEPPPTVVINSVPSPELELPLRYTLTPNVADIEAGNAAQSYYRALLLLPRDTARRYSQQQDDWLDLPLEEFPCEAAREWLGSYQNSLREVRAATYREDCDWDLQLRNLTGAEAISLPLPEMQESRTLARVLRVKSRLEIAEGRFEDARHTLVMGYRLAANVSDNPILLSKLIGIAIAGIMNESVIDWMNAGGPNLYWALAGLPTPLVDIRDALQQEMNLPVQIFPFLRDPESLSYSPEQWRQVIGEAMQGMAKLSDSTAGTSNLAAQTIAAGLLLAGYPVAKQSLIGSGMDAERVNAMPVGQVVAIQTARHYRKAYQESMKWTLLPYWQSYRQMRASIEKLRKEGYLGTNSAAASGAIPITSMLLPAFEATTFAVARMQRDISALQTVEAIRMSACATEGKVPATLRESQLLPLPIDPVTGDLVEYEVKDGKAVLMLPPPEGRSAEYFGKRFEVTLQRPATNE